MINNTQEFESMCKITSVENSMSGMSGCNSTQKLANKNWLDFVQEIRVTKLI